MTREGHVDDVLVSSKDDPDHLANLEMVLSRLSTAGLKLKMDKCSFIQPEVTYCGYIINGEGVQPVTAKGCTRAKGCQSVTGFPWHALTTTNVATVLEPLHKFLRKGTRWQWLKEQQTVFEKDKELLQSAQLLVHYLCIRHVKVVPYHPASNGLAERAVRTFKEGFEKMAKGSVRTKLSRFILSY